MEPQAPAQDAPRSPAVPFADAAPDEAAGGQTGAGPAEGPANLPGGDPADGQPAAPEGTGADGGVAEVDEAEVARYIAARGFVASTWLGAVLLVFSFGQLYWSLLSGVYAAQVGLFLGLLVGSLGAAVFLRSRRVYRSLNVPYLQRSVAVANVVAGAGGIFWLLFFFLTALVYAGVEILPS